MDDEQLLELLSQISELANMGMEALAGAQAAPAEGGEAPPEEPPA